MKKLEMKLATENLSSDVEQEIECLNKVIEERGLTVSDYSGL